MKIVWVILPFIVFTITSSKVNAQMNRPPLRIGIAGLSHDHVNFILGRPDQGDIQIVGIVESDKNLVKRYADRYHFPMNLVYNSLNEMLSKAKPEAVVAFGSIYDHLNIVESCAPLGIHVMVEKPLAVSMEHASKMKELADRYRIILLTDYETSWYPTNQKAYEMVQENTIGPLRKVVVHDGHKGPKEIGVTPEFFAWLTDPVLNGGGAVIDFGCYGANLITWLTNGQKPKTVMAMTQTIKPAIYPKVDDEATILLSYPDMQGIIQASWNWPVSRKDMEVYGRDGYIFSDNRHDLRYRLNEKESEKKEVLKERPAPYNEPFALLAAVIHKEITLPPFDPYSLENNMIVVEILEAAKLSSRTGKMIPLGH